MTAQGQQSRPDPPDLPAQQGEIGDILDIRNPVEMVGDAHAPGDDRRFCRRIEAGHPRDVGL